MIYTNKYKSNQTMKINKILFIDIFEKNTWIDEAVGMGSISAVLREHGYETKLVAYKEEKIDYDEISSFNPDFIGFSIHQRIIDAVKTVCERIVSLLPNTYLTLGGYLPTNNPEELMTSIPYINFIIRGEGEYTTLDLINTINNEKSLAGVDGITYRLNNNIVHNKNRNTIDDLDELPFPDRDILIKHNIHVARVEGARGCTSTCSFCSIHGFWSNAHSKECKNWRSKSVARFVDEIQYIVKEYNINRFHFLDSSFENPYLNSDRISNIAKEILARNLNITYYINMRADFHKIASEELLTLMIASGVNTIFIGVESFNSDDLKIFNKIATIDDAVKTIEVLKKFNIEVDLGLINFHPYSSLQGLRTNAYMLGKYGFASRLLIRNRLMVFKGTPIYDKIKNDNLLVGKYSDLREYLFVDKKVAIINTFLNSYMNNIKNSGSILLKLDTYVTRHISLIIHLKHYFNMCKDESAFQIVVDYEKKVRSILDDLNNRNTKWFLELVDLMENRWFEDAAMNIMNKYISKEHLDNTIVKFNKINLILFNNLLKINKDYANLL